MNDKILNIKISEKDFEMIIVSLLSTIQKCHENKGNPLLNKKEIEQIEADIQNYKKIITKLNVCKLYND